MLALRKVLVPISRGKWDQDMNRLAYLDHLRAEAAGRPDAALTAERLGMATARRQRAEMDLREKSGRLIDAEIARKRWSEVIVSIRSRMLSIPSKVAPLLTVDPEKNLRLLEGEIRDGLSELSQLPTKGA
jgi:phage terminase Nu1 subunit (DNA packaging protein)